MSEHYYSNQPSAKTNPKQVAFEARGQKVTLTTDSGVFSKQGLDYGTRVLLEAIQLPEIGVVVDLGCGYGPVTAVLAKAHPNCRYVLLDVNERAVALAKQNLAVIPAELEYHVSDGFSAVPELLANVILLNPPIRAGKAVVYRLFAEARSHLQPGGTLWVVIHKKHGAPSAKAHLETLFREVELVERDAGYHIFCCYA